MEGFNVAKIILGLRNPALFFKKIKGPQAGKVNNFMPELNSGLTNTKPQQNNVLQNIQSIESATKLIQMNTIANTDRSVFVKSLLGLPQTLGEILMNTQNLQKPLKGNTLDVGNLNQELLKNQKVLASLFDDIQQPIQPAITPEAMALLNQQTQKVQQDTVALIFSGMISMPDISKLILQNGKQAVAALIIAMASASKQGMSNEQIQETLSIINSCISMAESNNPAQTLKSLMLLYLPWLPLNEGVGFDLEITPSEGETESNDSKLTVLIQTKNFGNLKGVFTLTTSNSVDVLIVCTESFPKKILLENLKNESTSHAMNTNIDIESVQPIKEDIKETHETKVNLSATNEMNPYLLLMAHAFIRFTIMIDNSETLYAA